MGEMGLMVSMCYCSVGQTGAMSETNATGDAAEMSMRTSVPTYSYK